MVLIFKYFLVCLVSLITGIYSLNCPAGLYLSSHGDKCFSCPKGNYCVGDNKKKQCLSGYFADKEGSASCKICPIGNRCYYVDNPPVKCRKGKFQDQTGQRSCKWCKGGEYNTATGATSCKVCPVGHSCYYVDVSPTKCKKGMFQDLPGQRSCNWCKDGEYNTATGATSCKVCPVGHSCYYVDVAPIKCKRGKFQDLSGQRSCKWCKDGEYNTAIGATLCKVCPVGHSCYYVDVSPTKCKKGMFQNKPGKRKCKWCKDGQYSLNPGATKCNSCPAGSRCPYVDTIPLPCKSGEYSPSESVKCYKCPSGKFCPSSSTLPVAPYKDNILKSNIQRVVKFAAQAYKDDTDTKLRLIDKNNKNHGFVEYKNNTIIVSFRGSVDLKDWLGNVKFFKESYKHCPNCEVHKGFLSHFNSVRMEMLTRVSYFSHAHPNSKVIVTGHSLGGAQATLAAAELAKSGFNVDLITFGSPRIGNDKFSEYVNKEINGFNIRVTYADDIVTVTPPQSIGFRHVGQELHYTDPTNGYKLPTNVDVNYNRLSATDHKISNYENLN